MNPIWREYVLRLYRWSTKNDTSKIVGPCILAIQMVDKERYIQNGGPMSFGYADGRRRTIHSIWAHVFRLCGPMYFGHTDGLRRTINLIWAHVVRLHPSKMVGLCLQVMQMVDEEGSIQYGGPMYFDYTDGRRRTINPIWLRSCSMVVTDDRNGKMNPMTVPMLCDWHKWSPLKFCQSRPCHIT